MRLRLLVMVCLVASAFATAQNDNPQTPAAQPKKQSANKSDSDVKTASSPEKKSESAEKGKDQPKSKRSAKGKEQAKGESGKAEEEKPKDLLGSDTLGGFKWRSIGPAVISGRIVSIAVDPHDRKRFFIGAASGGVWKTENGGITFEPVFDNEGSYSIGTVSIDPNDSNVVWVGTGENNAQRSVSYGDGVYKSVDGGHSWKNMGLKNSQHIARVIVDPRDSNTVYVAAQGPLWSAGGDRGVFKSTDGGQTWKPALTISENTGVADLVMDPSNPDILYASAWQRRRHVWTMIDGGPESAVYKTTDKGEHWNKLAGGLPGGELGRIGLSVSPADPNVVYAVIEASNKKGGIFRSKDKGATWEKRNPFDSTGMYYATIIADPANVDRVYVMNFLTQVSDDGGKTLRHLDEHNKHVDTHVVWVDPNDPNYYLAGCDGGLYESQDRAQHWRYFSNLPLAQFYDVAVDNAQPFFYVYGGTQDNNSVGGPSQTTSASGIANSDWYITTGGDGFRSQVDPEDPGTVYAESQYGGLVRYDTKTGERVGIQPIEAKGEATLRWNWDSPIIISPHSHTRLYFAANKLFQSDDRGDTWKEISPDLTRQIDRDTLPVMGKIWGPDAVSKSYSTSFYGNIVAMAESPKKAGLLYVGTDDGLIQISDNDGGAWRKIEKFPGVPENTYVSRLAASNFDTNTVYAAFDNHKNGDFKPYLLKSTDGGSSWTSIATNLPENGPVLAIAEDPVKPGLLFVGTEFGAWMSLDGGAKWTQLKSGLPTIAVRDLVVHKRDNALVAATFGRGFYVLDDITPLRSLSAQLVQHEAALFAPERTLMFVPRDPLGGRGKASQGASYFVADNPKYGANFTFYLKDKYKTLKEKRQDAEKEAAKKNNGAAYPALKYPTKDELRAEAEEPAPAVYLTVADSAGNVVRKLTAANAGGWNRATWDLRLPPAELDEREHNEEEFDFGPVGPYAMPGQYKAWLSKKIDNQWTDLTQPVTFDVQAAGVEKMTPQDRDALFAFQKKVWELDRAVTGGVSLAQDSKSRIGKMRSALRDTAADTRELTQRADSLEKSYDEFLRAVVGDRALRQRQEIVPVTISDRVNYIEGSYYFATQKPTQSAVSAYDVAASDFAGELAKLKQLNGELSQLESDVEKAGAPWTPGRVPEWSPR